MFMKERSNNILGSKSMLESHSKLSSKDIILMGVHL